MITPRHAASLVHTLLDDRPFPITRDYESVQVDLEAVADGVVIHPRRQAAVAHQCFAIQAMLVRHTAEFGRVFRECRPRPPQIKTTQVRDWIQSR